MASAHAPATRPPVDPRRRRRRRRSAFQPTTTAANSSEQQQRDAAGADGDPRRDARPAADVELVGDRLELLLVLDLVVLLAGRLHLGGGGGGGGGLGTAICSVVLPWVSGSGVRERSGLTSTGTQPSSPASSSTHAEMSPAVTSARPFCHRSAGIL